jgi:hypothetical protein
LSNIAGRKKPWDFREIALGIRAMRALPIYAYIPLPVHGDESTERTLMLSAARDAGFITVDASDVYDGLDATTLTLDDADYHPNAAGHQVIAARLYRELSKIPGVLSTEPTVTPAVTVVDRPARSGQGDLR